MDEARINRLSKRQRDVLRGVAALKKTKQIAAELGIAPGTVDGYIAEAVRLLGATDRGEAARWLVRSDTAAPVTDAPGYSGGQSSWVGTSPEPVEEPSQPVAEPEALHGNAPRPLRTGSAIRAMLPIRRAGQRTNDLSIVARLLWIPAIALILAIGFGMLANGLKVLADLIERLSHLLR